jgi:hypothetical protein
LSIAGGILIAIALLSWWFNGPEYVAYIAAALAVAAFTTLSLDNFTTANSVSYGPKSITLKLLGHKTTGFLFSDVQQVSLQEQGLLIRVVGMDDMKLSRKRYTDQSLQELYTLLQEKTTLQ